MEEQKKLHPVIWVAGISVTALSLAGIGAIFGVIPHAGGKNQEPVAAVTQSAVQAPAQASAAASAPPALASASAVVEKPVAVVEAPKPEAAKPEPVKPRVQKVIKPKSHPAEPVQVAQAPGPDAVVPPPGTPYPPAGGAHPSAPAPVAVPVMPPHCPDCGVVDNVRPVTVKGQGSGVGVVAGGVLGGVLGRQVGNGTGRDLATIIGAVAGGYAGNEIEKSQRAATRYEVSVRMEDGSIQTITEPTSPAWAIGQKVRLVNGQILPR